MRPSAIAVQSTLSEADFPSQDPSPLGEEMMNTTFTNAASVHASSGIPLLDSDRSPPLLVDFDSPVVGEPHAVVKQMAPAGGRKKKSKSKRSRGAASHRKSSSASFDSQLSGERDIPRNGNCSLPGLDNMGYSPILKDDDMMITSVAPEIRCSSEPSSIHGSSSVSGSKEGSNDDGNETVSETIDSLSSSSRPWRKSAHSVSPPGSDGEQQSEENGTHSEVDVPPDGIHESVPNSPTTKTLENTPPWAIKTDDLLSDQSIEDC